MYQTVGQDAIEIVAKALNVPLYRRVISGSAVEQGSEYGGRIATNSGGIHGDETEDLFELLSTVKVIDIHSSHGCRWPTKTLNRSGILMCKESPSEPSYQTTSESELNMCKIGGLFDIFFLISTQLPASWIHGSIVPLAA